MRIQWHFNGCSKTIKSKARSYWQQKQRRVERLVSGMAPASLPLRLSVYCYPNRVDQFETRAVVRVTGRTLVAQISNEALNAALDLLADALVAALKSHSKIVKDISRQQHKKDTFSNLHDSLPMLIADEKEDRKDSFVALLRPIATFLEKQAGRELTFLEMDGLISPGFTTVGELVDDTIDLAWENFASKPGGKSLEHWLLGLLYEQLQVVEWEYNRIISPEREEHLLRLNKSPVSDIMANIDFHDSTLLLSDILPDNQTTASWEMLSDDEQRRCLYDVLCELYTQRRQSYLLYVVERYSADEIAQVQGRPHGDVQKDIARTKENVQRTFYEMGFLTQSPIINSQKQANNEVKI